MQKLGYMKLAKGSERLLPPLRFSMGNPTKQGFLNFLLFLRRQFLELVEVTADRLSTLRNVARYLSGVPTTIVGLGVIAASRYKDVGLNAAAMISVAFKSNS